MKHIRRFSLLALAVACSGCASTTGAVPKPFPTPGGANASHRATASGSKIVETALDLRGSPYRNGGTDPAGFDCSGFTQYVFARYSVALPRETRDQFLVGKSVGLNDVAPGDLLFFTTSAPGASHVGIAISRGEFVHAPSSTGVVRVERLTGGYWSRRFLGARRLTPP
jgi:cell wall-associated NlpC family hydrolase